MDVEAQINYKDSPVRFRIRQERKGIFTACLISPEDANNRDLPKEITMIRSIRNWTGSIDDEKLLRELGGCIDAHWPARERH